MSYSSLRGEKHMAPLSCRPSRGRQRPSLSTHDFVYIIRRRNVALMAWPWPARADSHRRRRVVVPCARRAGLSAAYLGK